MARRNNGTKDAGQNNRSQQKVLTDPQTPTTIPPPSGIKRPRQIGGNSVQQQAEPPHEPNESASDLLVPNSSEWSNEEHFNLSLDEPQKSQIGNTKISENGNLSAVLNRGFSLRRANPYLLNRYLDQQCDNVPGRLFAGAGTARQRSSNDDPDDGCMCGVFIALAFLENFS